MSNEEIIAHLKTKGDALSLADALRLIAELGGAAMTQFRAIVCLKAAFPELPLNVAMEASTSKHVVGDGGLDDSAINQLFSTSV